MFAIETEVLAQAKDTVVEKSEAMKDTAIEKGTQVKDTIVSTTKTTTDYNIDHKESKVAQCLSILGFQLYI